MKMKGMRQLLLGQLTPHCTKQVEGWRRVGSIKPTSVKTDSQTTWATTGSLKLN